MRAKKYAIAYSEFTWNPLKPLKKEFVRDDKDKIKMFSKKEVLQYKNKLDKANKNFITKENIEIIDDTNLARLKRLNLKTRLVYDF